jgi:hypothetical protein
VFDHLIFCRGDRELTLSLIGPAAPDARTTRESGLSARLAAKL